jgi:hypothetical protein
MMRLTPEKRSCTSIRAQNASFIWQSTNMGNIIGIRDVQALHSIRILSLQTYANVHFFLFEVRSSIFLIQKNALKSRLLFHDLPQVPENPSTNEGHICSIEAIGPHSSMTCVSDFDSS